MPSKPENCHQHDCYRVTFNRWIFSRPIMKLYMWWISKTFDNYSFVIFKSVQGDNTQNSGSKIFKLNTKIPQRIFSSVTEFQGRCTVTSPTSGRPYTRQAADEFSLPEGRAPHAVRVGLNPNISEREFEKALSTLSGLLAAPPVSVDLWDWGKMIPIL